MISRDIQGNLGIVPVDYMPPSNLKMRTADANSVQNADDADKSPANDHLRRDKHLVISNSNADLHKRLDANR